MSGIIDLQDLILNTLLKSDPKVIEEANLLMGDTLDLSEVVKKIESSFVKDKDGRRMSISMTYEEWRAVKKMLYMCSMYFTEQADQVTALQKKIEPFNDIVKLKDLGISFDAGECSTGFAKYDGTGGMRG